MHTSPSMSFKMDRNQLRPQPGPHHSPVITDLHCYHQPQWWMKRCPVWRNQLQPSICKAVHYCLFRCSKVSRILLWLRFIGESWPLNCGILLLGGKWPAIVGFSRREGFTWRGMAVFSESVRRHACVLHLKCFCSLKGYLQQGSPGPRLGWNRAAEKKWINKVVIFFFYQSEKSIILKKDRIHPCVRLSHVQES